MEAKHDDQQEYFKKLSLVQEVTPCLHMCVHVQSPLSTGDCQENYIQFLVPYENELMREGRVGLSFVRIREVFNLQKVNLQ